MKRKTAYLIINPRLGKNVARLTDILVLFSAAGWKTDIALKEFGGHTMQLAGEAAEEDYDLVIGYGGDGPSIRSSTASWRPSVAAVSSDSSLVEPPMSGPTRSVCRKIRSRPLFLINSEGRKVDLGHISADSVDLPRNHFLLMAGLGIDAAIMRRCPLAQGEDRGKRQWRSRR